MNAASAGGTWPAWFTPGKNTPRLHCQNVAYGLHPLGRALGPEDKSCSQCAHRYANRMGKTYWKCRLIKSTGGPATDLRLKWRACEKFKEQAV